MVKIFPGGFRKGRGTADQLMEFRERIVLASRDRKVCVTAFLDISAAYDSVWKEGLVYKLINFGLRGRMLVWIVNFLRSRFGAVCVAGVRSEISEYAFGLPQGSCLSPILFNLFLSDLFQADFVNQSRSAGIFADDVRVSRFHSNINLAARDLTLELDKVALFARKWRINFDAQSSKCGTMTLALFDTGQEASVSFGGTVLNRLSEYKYLGVTFDPRLKFTAHIETVRKKAWAAFHGLRELTSRLWGASTKIMVRLFRAFVTPVLEYACQVWATARKSTLKRLESVQTAALRCATGALWSTSQAAMEVYCGVWPLEVRREFLCVSLFYRIRSLCPEEHPVAAVYQLWRTKGPRHRYMCFFGLAESFSRSYRHHQRFSDGGDRSAEIITPFDFPPWDPRPQAEKLSSKAEAASRHRQFVKDLDADVIRVFTDGSASPNPGAAGAGAVICSPLCTYLLSEPVGIASSLTAELFALKIALRFLLSVRHQHLKQHSKVIVFVDSIVAINFSCLIWLPSSNVNLCRDIHNALLELGRKNVRIKFRWVPSHEGIPENEAADRLAARGASLISKRTIPLLVQPPIPHTVAKGMAKSAIWERQQERWLKVLTEHLSNEHLSRIQVGVRSQSMFSVGNRRTQTTLAQLRFGHTKLNAHQFRFMAVETPICDCGGAEESVAHYLLECPLFDSHRFFLVRTVTAILPFGVELSENILLGGSEFTWGKASYGAVARAVMKFVRNTGRFG